MRQIKAQVERKRSQSEVMSCWTSSTPARSDRRVVLVDDDAALLHALAFAFETEGYRVVSYASGEALLANTPQLPGCFVVDQHLPGVAGMDLIERLRAGGEAAPAFLITTHPTRDVRMRAVHAGVEIVEKPLMGDALAQRVRRLFALH